MFSAHNQSQRHALFSVATLTSLAFLSSCDERKAPPPIVYGTLAVEDRISRAAQVVADFPSLVVRAAPALRQLRGILAADALEGFATKYITSYQGLRDELTRKTENNQDIYYYVPAMGRFSSFGINQFRAWFAGQSEPTLGKIVLNVGEMDEVVRQLFMGTFTISDFNSRLTGLECFIRQTLNNE